MSVFERYLTVWVGLCIVVGVALGHVLPGVFQAIGAAEHANVNIPMAVLIWLMIIPDAGAHRLRQPQEGRRLLARDRVTLFINWAVKPFSMALLGWLFIGHLFRPWLPGRADRQLHRRPDHPGRRALHRHGLRLVEPDPGRAAFHPDPGGAQRCDHDRGLRADRRPAARPFGDHRALGHARAVGGALHRRAGDRRPGPAARAPGQRAARPRSTRRCSVLQPLSIGALLATLVLLFGFQGEQIIAQPLVIALLAVPILIQVYFNSGLAYLLNRVSGEQHCVAGPSALIGASQLLRARRRRRHQPVRLQLRRRAGDRGRRADRSAGDALRRLDREQFAGTGTSAAPRRALAARTRPDQRTRRMSIVTIYHNPDCGTSRNALALIRASGEEPEVIEYLQAPPSRERLRGADRGGGPDGARGDARRRARPTSRSAWTIRASATTGFSTPCWRTRS